MPRKRNSRESRQRYKELYKDDSQCWEQYRAAVERRLRIHFGLPVGDGNPAEEYSWDYVVEILQDLASDCADLEPCSPTG